jgi:hypothetical protein
MNEVDRLEDASHTAVEHGIKCQLDLQEQNVLRRCEERVLLCRSSRAA